MNSVDKIMRVNELAQQLLNQGVVASRDEAVKKAEEMMNTNIAKADVVNDGNEQQVVPQEESSQSNSQEQSQEAQNSETQMSQTPSQSNAQVNADNEQVTKLYNYVKEQFSIFKDNIVKLNNEIKQVKEDLESLRTRMNSNRNSSAPSSSQQSSNQSSDQSSSDNSQSENKDSSDSSGNSGASHPRAGSTNPDDVAIDKMFYYGNKR